MSRTGQQRLDAIPAAIALRDVFKMRVEAAGQDIMRCADLMAETILANDLYTPRRIG